MEVLLALILREDLLKESLCIFHTSEISSGLEARRATLEISEAIINSSRSGGRPEEGSACDKGSH